MPATAILKAREERWQGKLDLAAHFQAPVLSICLNIPGPDKNITGTKQALKTICSFIAPAIEKLGKFGNGFLKQTAPTQLHPVLEDIVSKPFPQKKSDIPSKIIHASWQNSADGPYVQAVCNIPPIPLKLLAIKIESVHPLGRLTDIDVFCPSNGLLSRTQLGVAPRSCFLCGDSATVCRRAARHTMEELLNYVSLTLAAETDNAIKPQSKAGI